jgi:TatD DNase family protein
VSGETPIIDTHVHLDVEPLDDAAWAAARAAGVCAALAVGVAPATWERTIAAARRLEGVGLALGIHPQVVPALDDAAIDDALARLPSLLVETGAAAVGECGLDGPSGEMDRQRRVLLAQLRIAREAHLPISLHVFRAHGPAIDLLRAFGPLPAGGVVHGYSGPAELVPRYLAAGLSISFAGAITRSNARRPILAARVVPAEHLLIETDAPYQPTGADARDRKYGEPRDLRDVVRVLARVRGEEEEEVARRTTGNALRIFPRLGSGPAPRRAR